MSLIKILPEDIERYELRANPKCFFVSSSLGVTGSLPLFSDGSASFKDVYASPGLYANSASDDNHIESYRSAAMTNRDFYAVDQYINAVHAATPSTKFSKSQKVIRFEPSTMLDKNFMRKHVVRKLLFPYYRHKYPSAQWNYTNYHTLNFVTGGNLPTETVLVYPAGTGTFALENCNALAPSSSFTFDFYLNPRYTTTNIGANFNPGTIFHMSSCYAISLVTGTQMGIDGKPSGYRLLLQLSQSAEIPPKFCKITGNTVTAPDSKADKGFLFVSDDNSLQRNNWHHVGIRWGGSNTNAGRGSFFIDGKDRGTFTIASQSCMQATQAGGTIKNDPDALFVGNFFEGSNSGGNAIAGYFGTAAQQTDGVTPFGSHIDASLDDPTDTVFRHPLNAEVHDLKIFQTYRNDQQLLTSSLSGYAFNTASVSMTGSQELIFYVPPFFSKDTLPRSVLQTPFQFLENSATDDPFNVALSFGVGGHELNLENFVKEFVRGTHPRLLGLTSSEINTTTSTVMSCNEFLYASGSTRKRNISVLPCDNGRFYPNFDMLLTDGLTAATSGTSIDRFVNEFGGTDTSVIKLTDLVMSSSAMKNIGEHYTTGRGSFFDNVPTDGRNPDAGVLIAPVSSDGLIDPGIVKGQILTILQRTGDSSSNEIVFFDVSNMFYGDRIKPGSVTLTDTSVTGSAGRVSITLKDDGYGNLYRADALTPLAKWASVGNVIYEEGLLIVKSPNIPMFGSVAWKLSFEGERNIHVYEVNVPAPKAMINLSNNPTFQDMQPTDYPSETAGSFVYLTGLNLHDENLNVVGRVNLAQPLVKRDSDRYVVRCRIDY